MPSGNGRRIEKVETARTTAERSRRNAAPVTVGNLRTSKRTAGCFAGEPGEYENGFHDGQNADPKAILRDLHERGIRHVVFRTTGMGQFDINFEAWRKEVV